MRILLLGPANSIHIERWFRALHERGHDVTLATQHPPVNGAYPSRSDMRLLPHRGMPGYALNARELKRLAGDISPDVMNVHYASGYGLTSALVKFTPTVLSVWGSDVFDFPYESWFKGKLIRWNLRRADQVASTSEVMARQVGRLVGKLRAPVAVTPFGVDTSLFAPTQKEILRDQITIGTVKTLAHKYGIDTLVRAFAIARASGELGRLGLSGKMRLTIVGDGPLREELPRLAERLGIGAVTRFVGAVAHSSVPSWLGQLDIYVAASRLDSESFGVAVIEASSCGLPVIVSDAGGLPEVVEEGQTGFIVKRDNPEMLAERIERLVRDVGLRTALGARGRELVLRKYDWQACVDRMLGCYQETIERTGVRTRKSSDA